MVIDSADLIDVAGRVAKEIDRLSPQMTFIDVTGIGAGVYDRLVERGYGAVLTAVNFGAAAATRNRRSRTAITTC